jgi:hypothetical protein
MRMYHPAMGGSRIMHADINLVAPPSGLGGATKLGWWHVSQIHPNGAMLLSAKACLRCVLAASLQLPPDRTTLARTCFRRRRPLGDIRSASRWDRVSTTRSQSTANSSPFALRPGRGNIDDRRDRSFALETSGKRRYCEDMLLKTKAWHQTLGSCRRPHRRPASSSVSD